MPQLVVTDVLNCDVSFAMSDCTVIKGYSSRFFAVLLWDSRGVAGSGATFTPIILRWIHTTTVPAAIVHLSAFFASQVFSCNTDAPQHYSVAGVQPLSKSHTSRGRFLSQEHAGKTSDDTNTQVLVPRTSDHQKGVEDEPGIFQALPVAQLRGNCRQG